MRPIAHFKTITKHKLLVMRYCFSVGLYRQGLLHDMSKYSPTEFWVGAKYYQGVQSPNNAERMDRGYSSAWLHHRGRNKHHFEYWLDYSLDSDKSIEGMKMPLNYAVEMFLDRVAAGKIYNGDAFTPDGPLKYYEKGHAKTLLHPKTRELLEFLLHMYAEKGEKATFSYIKMEILAKKDWNDYNNF